MVKTHLNEAGLAKLKIPEDIVTEKISCGTTITDRASAVAEGPTRKPLTTKRGPITKPLTTLRHAGNASCATRLRHL